MKRFSSILLILALIAAMVCPVFAAGVNEPVIGSVPPDYYLPVGSEAALWVDIAKTDGGTLKFQWCKSNTDNIATIKAIDGATEQTYTFKGTKAGVEYYCCGIWTVKDGMQSSPAYTRMIKVEFYKPEPLLPKINAEMPDCRLEVGQSLELWADASSTNNGYLHYQWYSTSKDNITTIKAIDGATTQFYTIKGSKPGTTYYCCGISQASGGELSPMVYTRLVKVEFYEAAPKAPVIKAEMPDCYMPAGGELTLWTDAASPDGGELTYEWYVSPTESRADIKLIKDATAKEYKVPDTEPGVRYYCCLISNWKKGQKGGPVFTRMVRVEFYSLDPQPDDKETVESISLMQLPDKTEYEYGEELDLKGLKVRVFTSMGFMDVTDFSELKISGYDASKAGDQTITIGYEDKTASFTVKVNDKKTEPPVDPAPQNNTSNTDPQPSHNVDPKPEPDTKKSFMPVVYVAAGVIAGCAAGYFIFKKKK